ncbi:hypothetical protein FisN_11Lh023 [Fistulifera solaris]|uniref:RRM domain-containing protein n=1 Tax=Fistulifera solaris TaxID=1519565 RepID=A0A1Z5J7L4_FISSO|nr:hypothetical protein FisN_11Lh023 [Fistulifera solaris]|eukprot:GAX09984.1 hypothetical protein FisN_11Lh023 [Fistulifera solaris]
MLRSVIWSRQSKIALRGATALGPTRWQSGGDKKNKSNFDRDVLQRAARGELGPKHTSGIPKLAGRKTKARLTPPVRNDASKIYISDHEDLEEEEDDDMDVTRTNSLREALSKGRERDVNLDSLPFSDDDSDEEPEYEGDRYVDEYYASDVFDDNKYYWREEDYDGLECDVDDEAFEKDENGYYVIPYERVNTISDHNITGALDQIEEEPTMSDDFWDDMDDEMQKKTRGDTIWQQDNPEDFFFFDQHDLFTIAGADPSSLKDNMRLDNVVLPLQEHGPDLDDFLESVIKHPTNFAKVNYENTHPTSQREPKPDFPPNRAQPTLDFVESHARFLYVSGLPPLEVGGEAGELENPLHRNALQKKIADLFDLDSTQVFPANNTSGFVGLSSPRQLSDILLKGPNQEFFSVPATISRPDEVATELDFVKASDPGAVVMISKIPPNHSPLSLARDLFPANTEIGAVYGKGLSADHFYFMSQSKVLVRFSSKKQADSAIESDLVKSRLRDRGKYPVQIFRARRELVHDKFGGPAKTKELRKPGPRLIVDGDMPSKNFFLTHADVVYMWGADQCISKAEISKAFNEFSSNARDVEGSIEFVTCHAGRPTGRVYIGFDNPGEAEEMLKSTYGRLKIGDRTVRMRLVRNRLVPNRALQLAEKRPDRKEDELIDDLNNWEKYVDPADLELLEKAGINKVALDESLRTFRFHNPTFGALDSSLRSEALRPELERGQQYKELVQMYVETLKECLPSREEPGLIYEALHFPDEPIDLTIFDREKERQKVLNEKRARS